MHHVNSLFETVNEDRILLFHRLDSLQLGKLVQREVDVFVAFHEHDAYTARNNCTVSHV